MFAKAWGSELVFVGQAGHINTASGHGPWLEGRALLQRFCERLSGRSLGAHTHEKPV